MKNKNNFLKTALGVFLMTTAFTFANNTDPLEMKESPSELNKEYIKVVHENSAQDEAKFLSGIISEYDVRSSEGFDSSIDDKFMVVFKSNKGYARVAYDNKGRIINVKKYLKNVSTPNDISDYVSENYEGWKIVDNKYKETYDIGGDVEKSYVLTLNQGKEKKKIRVKG